MLRRDFLMRRDGAPAEAVDERKPISGGDFRVDPRPRLNNL